MLRYRITCDPKGRYVVLPAATSVAPIGQTYATRLEAQDAASWLNSLRQGSQQAKRQGLCVN